MPTNYFFEIDMTHITIQYTNAMCIKYTTYKYYNVYAQRTFTKL